MATPPSKEKKIKRLEKQIKKYASTQPKKVENFIKRINTLDTKYFEEKAKKEQEAKERLKR